MEIDRQIPPPAEANISKLGIKVGDVEKVSPPLVAASTEEKPSRTVTANEY